MDTLNQGNTPIVLDDSTQEDRAEPGVALALSGGGYRAMLFHVGSLWRLYELDQLRNIDRVSSVSGGSITAAVLAMAWKKLSFDPSRVIDDFTTHVVSPIRKLASKTIDRRAVAHVFLPGSVGDAVTEAYRDTLFGDLTLQDLPDTPRFVINATNVQSGALWRFSKPYMRDYRVGEVKNPDILLAQAVAASSAFPPVLSPVQLEIEPSDFTPDTGEDLQTAPYTNDVMLTDGGVYDNLGLQTCFDRYRTLLVSDAGGKLSAEPEPHEDWARHIYRVLGLIDNQVRSLRKRQLIDAYERSERDGTYWSIRTDQSDYELDTVLPCPRDWALDLASEPTRLKRINNKRQEALINWGYAICDTALRKHVVPNASVPTAFPYPGAAP